MHNSRKRVPGSQIDIRSVDSTRGQPSESELIGRIEDATPSRGRTGIQGGSPSKGRNISKIRSASGITAVPGEQINAEVFAVSQRKLADNRAQCHLWRTHVHFVENLSYLHDDLAIAQNDN